jgi:hypothetical protein
MVAFGKCCLTIFRGNDIEQIILLEKSK